MRGAALLLLAGAPSAWAGGIEANERRTIEHLWLLLRAESHYASWNSGLYGTPACLATPAECIRVAEGPLPLERRWAALPDLFGYRFRFHAGPQSVDPPGLMRFAFTAVPVRQGVTGRRWFCVDQDGVIREADGPPLTAENGGCVRAARTTREPPPSSADEAEALTIADLRVVASAEQAYASANGGYFDRLDCLAEPWHCLPSTPKDAPLFLDPQRASLNERHGYRRRFHPGPRPPVAQRSRWESPTSMLSYAFTAVPGSAGRRSFCTDARGVICVVDDGREPRVVDAQCEPCAPLP